MALSVMKSPFTVALALIASSANAADKDDRSTITNLEQQQAAAWNAHDSGRYAALFTQDADVVNVLGWHWTSRTELHDKLGAAFASIFAKSRMAIVDTSVKFVKPDVAVAHVRWTMTGALSPTGSASDTPEQGIQTQVLVRRGGKWLIASFQNTNSVPERPFPLPVQSSR